MKKLILPIILILGLAACASPAVNMSPEQVSQLSNDQLCQLKNSYAWEQKTEVEIGKRNLNCDPIYNQCRYQGHEDGSPQLASCMQQIRENLRLKQQMQAQQQEMERQQRRNEINQSIQDLQHKRMMQEYYSRR